MNLIAIGILVLLAISLMISSKHVRAFVGSMIAVIVLLGVAAFALLGLQPKLNPQEQGVKSAAAPRLERLKQSWHNLVKPNVRDTVEATSARILDAVTQGDAADEDEIDKIVSASVPSDSEQQQDASAEEPKARKGKQSQTLILVPKSGNKLQDQISLAERISNAVDQRLAWYRKRTQSPGVDRLRAKHLDLNQFLDWHVIRVGDKNQLHAKLTFGDDFYQHVQQRGLDLVKHYRLKRTVYACGWTLGSMTVVFGLLRFRRTRRKSAASDDHLLSSGVSMV